MSNHDYTERLEEKVKNYEDFMKKLNENPRHVSQVLAGPDDKGFYRLGGDEGKDMIAHARPGVVPEVGQRVIVLANHIVEVLPEILDIVTDEVPEFDKVDWKDIGG